MLYNMLTGRMPWTPSRACLQRPLSMSGPTWKNVGEEAKSLVQELLHTDQAFRADVEQARHHPWFEGIHHCARMPTSAPGVKAPVSSVGSDSTGSETSPKSTRGAGSGEFHDGHERMLTARGHEVGADDIGCRRRSS